ncbi:MAG: lysophospholipid acyltransferase family protein [Phycisphaerales bacterium]|nr:lysophospholipid acyltransferase family protein [Phycisphaerales bacterium]
MLDVVQRGELLAFIADQDAGAKGLFVPFFGKLASTYKSIGLLALHQNLPIICGYAMRRSQTRGCQYQLGTTDVIHPHEWADHPDPLFYVTARYTRAIEKMVRLALPQYFWMHRRWKTRPRWEREGKAMPVSVRKNLESLPWMTPAELDSLGIPIPAQDLSV